MNCLKKIFVSLTRLLYTIFTYMSSKNIIFLKKYCIIQEEDKRFLISALENLQISARVYDKILKIARTIADLAGEKEISRKHLLEAISFKNNRK